MLVEMLYQGSDMIKSTLGTVDDPGVINLGQWYRVVRNKTQNKNQKSKTKLKMCPLCWSFSLPKASTVLSCIYSILSGMEILVLFAFRSES